MSLADATWRDVAKGSTVLVPVGSTEQHGPHLPLDTDTVIATALANGLAPLLGAVVAPPITYGSSGEHQSFNGTMSVGTEVLRLIVVELVRSLSTWAGRVVLVNGHGGNVAALRSAVSQLRAEGQLVGGVSCSIPGREGEHAGRAETSLMLHLDERRVRWDRALPGNTEPLADLMPAMVAGGVEAVSPTGVLGDPIGASAIEGKRFLRQMTSAAYHRVRIPIPAR